MAGKQRTAQQNAARKQRQRDRKASNKPLSQPSAPYIIASTNTAQNQLVQSRRWLKNEQALKPQRFPHAAILQVFALFNKDPAIRAVNSFDRLSPEAKRVVQTIEAERAQAIAAGQTGDWWEGAYRKGVTVEEQQTAAATRKHLRSRGITAKQLLGIDEVLMEAEMGIGDTNAAYMDDVEPIEEEEGLNEVLDGMEGGTGMSQEWELSEEEGEREEAGDNEEGDVEMGDA